MAGKRNKKTDAVRRASSEVRVRRIRDANAWELLHPRCALDREDDIEEVRAMLQAGEVEIAVEELRWLLSGCGDFIRAHRMLGELAWSVGDIQLARGHFGHGYNIAAKALKKAGRPKPVPYALEANQDFFECGKGLIRCLQKLAKRKMVDEVVNMLLRCDPTDAVGVKQLLSDSD